MKMTDRTNGDSNRRAGRRWLSERAAQRRAGVLLLRARREVHA
jgi:hypothetical protein